MQQQVFINDMRANFNPTIYLNVPNKISDIVLSITR